jgi:hypothetical protein
MKLRGDEWIFLKRGDCVVPGEQIVILWNYPTFFSFVKVNNNANNNHGENSCSIMQKKIYWVSSENFLYVKHLVDIREHYY